MAQTTSIDLASAASVLTGEPSGKTPHQHAPQVGRVLATCSACDRACGRYSDLCEHCSSIEVVSAVRLSRLDGTYAVTWYWQHSGFETTTIVTVTWQDGGCFVDAGEGASGDVEHAIAEYMLDEDDRSFREQLAAAGRR